MAATFEFSSNVLNLSIAGHQFQVDISARDVQTNMQEVIQSAELSSQTDSDNVQKVMDLCVQGIDGLLGTDATKTIFGDKVINFYDLVDLMVFLETEITNFKLLRMSKYASRLNHEHFN